MLITIIVIATVLSGDNFAKLDAVPDWVWVLSVVYDFVSSYFITRR